MNTPNTLQKIVEEVRTLAKNYPNARYRVPRGMVTAKYTKGKTINGPETPGCLIGQALRNCQLPGIEPWLENVDAHASVDVRALLSEYFGTDLYSEPHLTPIEWLGVVQAEQDSKSTWAKAVREADSQRNTNDHIT